MATNLEDAVDGYLRVKTLSAGTRSEYSTTLKKWTEWGEGVPIEQLRRREVRAFLDWVYEQAVAQGGTNSGRTANKARENLRLSWPGRGSRTSSIRCHDSRNRGTSATSRDDTT